ncbi:MAG: prepilin-type N-terminal cleavage/methylation domain-containing protein [Bacilli bacterium]|nr:prepilin-type N-terminal cleavage/methylation domain-containing protein [Bacilli bacterium]
MKNKKGFTMIELLAVIVVLGVIISIASLSISKIMEKNKQKAYETKVEVILKQAKQYAYDNENIFYNSDKRFGNYVCEVISVQDLISGGYIDANDKELVDDVNGDQVVITNPLTQESMTTLNILLYIKSKESPSSPKYDSVGIYNGSIVSALDLETSVCKVATNKVVSEFADSQTEQTMTIDKTGTYVIEAWGAQGGGNTQENGGYGAYAYAEVDLTEGQVLYINVGGQGNNNTGGYNGGGNAANSANYKGYGGGGATSVALRSGLLSTLSSNVSDILLVAAGGGGGGTNGAANGGAGGGIRGVNGINTNAGSQGGYVGTGASQTEAGYNATHTAQKGSFGQGANYYPTVDSNNVALGGAGGGGGLYGGGGSCRTHAGAGGGSSYIGNSDLSNAAVYCYNCVTSSNENTKTIVTTTVENQPVSRAAKMGNGYVKISLKEKDSILTIFASNIRYDNSQTHVNCQDVQCMLDHIARLVK